MPAVDSYPLPATLKTHQQSQVIAVHKRPLGYLRRIPEVAPLYFSEKRLARQPVVLRLPPARIEVEQVKRLRTGVGEVLGSEA